MKLILTGKAMESQLGPLSVTTKVLLLYCAGGWNALIPGKGCYDNEVSWAEESVSEDRRFPCSWSPHTLSATGLSEQWQFLSQGFCSSEEVLHVQKQSLEISAEVNHHGRQSSRSVQTWFSAPVWRTVMHLQHTSEKRLGAHFIHLHFPLTNRRKLPTVCLGTWVSTRNLRETWYSTHW